MIPPQLLNGLAIAASGLITVVRAQSSTFTSPPAISSSSSAVPTATDTRPVPVGTARPVPTQARFSKILHVVDQNDVCLLLPAVPDISIDESEGSAVSKCTANGTRDTEPLDKQFILSAHAVKTPNHIQYNLIGMRVSERGGGGQYDDASWGIEPFSHCLNYDRYVEIVGGDQFCIRCCNYPPGTDLRNGVDYDRNSPCYAGYDTAGCARVVPGNYGPGFTYTESGADHDRGGVINCPTRDGLDYGEPEK
ncbi:hypothetical protein HDU96_001157 [Phlyctochytrium bullatum]|nr:hypothetical protein HDU96_001157 [Phlyctochytrium bullatum]